MASFANSLSKADLASASGSFYQVSGIRRVIVCSKHQLRPIINAGPVSQRIAAYDKLSGLNSIIGLSPTALSEAAALDQQLLEIRDSGGELPPMFCVPTIMKDL